MNELRRHRYWRTIATSTYPHTVRLISTLISRHFSHLVSTTMKTTLTNRIDTTSQTFKSHRSNTLTKAESGYSGAVRILQPFLSATENHKKRPKYQSSFNFPTSNLSTPQMPREIAVHPIPTAPSYSSSIYRTLYHRVHHYPTTKTHSPSKPQFTIQFTQHKTTSP